MKMQWIDNKKKHECFWLLIIFFLAILFTHFDYLFAYKNVPIGKINYVKKLSEKKSKNYYHNNDYSNIQRLHIKVLNGKYQGKTISIKNHYLTSQALTQRYHSRQYLLLNYKDGWSIVDQKRDTILVFIAGIVFIILILFTDKLSLKIISSLFFNFIFFLLAIIIDTSLKKIYPVVIFTLLSVILTFITLRLILGKGVQFFIVFLSTIISTILGVSLGSLIIIMNKERGIHFEFMDFVTQFPIPIFYSQLLIGALGAVMDEASDIAAGMLGIFREGKKRNFINYFNFGMETGKNIVGSLTNVLFMVFIANTFPIMFVYLRNGNTWSYTIEITMALGLISTIISAISIVLTVPITSGISSAFLSRAKPRRIK